MGKKICKRFDMKGKQFGNLSVLFDVGRIYGGKIAWLCRCDCGNEIIASAGDLRQGKYISCGCRKWVGKDNPRWRGGHCRTSGLYPSEWNKKLRKKIRELDNNMCRFPKYCSKIYNGRKLDVHHIDGDKNNCEDWNLISLCNHHHQYVESHNPREYEKYFYVITKSRNG